MTNGFITRVLASALLVGAAVPAAAQATLEPGLPATVESLPLGTPPGPVVQDPLSAAIAAVLAAPHAADPFVIKRREAAVAGFYEQRGNAPAWVDEIGPTANARRVIERLAAANEDGLDPAALGVPAASPGWSPAELATFDVALSRAVVAFAEEASGGRVQPSKVNAEFITRKPERVDPIEALSAVAAAGDPASVLERFNPPHPAFAQLKAKLAEVRGRVAEPLPDPISEGKTLKPGMSDPRVASLRARMDLPAATDPLMADLYDDEVVAAVKVFQSGAGLADDGIIGPRTLAMLNGEARDEEGEIVANMEMWRWMPRDLGTDHVFVNIPEFMVRVLRHGSVTHATRVVVGTPQNQTPVFSDELEYLVVNPYWHVPESIRAKEMLPEIQADPSGFFRRNGYEAVWNGQVIDPASVLWDETAIKYVAIRQPPSEANALGRIKFMFPNQHAVYLHDTPSRKLFERNYRAYSHGCVRVHEPMAFANAILEGEPDLDVARLEAMFGGNERHVDLSQRLKVHIGYFTTWVDEAGVLQMRDDLYGHTGKIKQMLEKSATATQ